MGNDQKLGRWGRLAPLSSSSSSMAGTDAGGSSLVTLDLPKAPLAELANVVDLYQSIFGITPDVSAAESQSIDDPIPTELNTSLPTSTTTVSKFSNVNDTSSFYQRVQDIILSSTP